MEGPDLQFSEAVIDNGALGRHVVRFETDLGSPFFLAAQPIVSQSELVAMSYTSTTGVGVEPKVSPLIT